MSVLQISPLTVQSLFPLGQAVALLPPEPDEEVIQASRSPLSHPLTYPTPRRLAPAGTGQHVSSSLIAPWA